MKKNKKIKGSKLYKLSIDRKKNHITCLHYARTVLVSYTCVHRAHALIVPHIYAPNDDETLGKMDGDNDVNSIIVATFLLLYGLSFGKQFSIW